MAKKTTISADLFKSTDTNQEETKTKNYPVSVYITAEERAELDDMAKAAGLTRHALLQFAVKEFMKRYRAGEIKAETETVKVTVLKVQE